MIDNLKHLKHLKIKKSNSWNSSETHSIIWLLKVLLAAYAFSDTALTVLDYEYAIDIPVLKYFFAIMQNISGWGMHSVFTTISLAFIFYFIIIKWFLRILRIFYGIG